MALLEGLSEDVLKTAKSTHHAEAHRLMKALKYYGFKTAILSGGSPTLGSIYKRIGDRLRSR
jgi:phosphoserine phosphatase